MKILVCAIVLVAGSLPSMAAIRGEIVDRNGDPVAGAAVAAYLPESQIAMMTRAFSSKTERVPIASATTSESGSFELDTKRSGFVTVMVSANGFAPRGFRARGDEEVGAVALATAAERQGTVTASGKPVANALVFWRSNDAELQTKTAADGTYRVPDPRRWNAWGVVIHPSHAPLLEHAESVFLPKGALTHKLTDGLKLRGRVTSGPKSSPVAGCTIFVDDLPYGRSGDDGSFELAHVHEDGARVYARCSGMSGTGTRTQPGFYSITARPNAVINGTVRDAATKRTLEGVSVRVASDVHGGAEGHTDEKGVFTISVLPGNYYFMVSAPQYRFVGDTGNAYEQLEIGPKATKDVLLTALKPIRGRVLDEDGKPVGGAIVKPAAGDGMPSLALVELESISRRDGSFVYRNVEGLSSFEEGEAPAVSIVATKQNFAGSEPVDVKLSSDEPVTLTILKGHELSGRVTNVAGKPIAGATVTTGAASELEAYAPWAILELDGSGESRQPKTDADGRFSLRVRPGKYDVRFQAAGYAAKKVTHEATARAVPIEVKLEEASALSGKVLRDDGTPVESVYVAAMQGNRGAGRAQTSADGSFTFDSLTEGAYELRFYQAEEFVNETRSVTAPNTKFVLRLGPTGKLRGKVFDAKTHTPLPDFELQLTPTGDEDADMALEQPRHDEQGAFLLERVPVGTATLRVKAAGYRPREIEATISKGSEKSVEVALERGLTLHGRVRDKNGAAVEAVAVMLDDTSPYSVPHGSDEPVVTDDAGRFELTGLADGPAKIRFHKEGWVSKIEPVDVSATTAVEVVLDRGYTLSGRVTSDGTPVRGARIWLSSSNVGADGGSAESKSDGSFVVTGLGGGRYTVNAMHHSGQREIEDFEIADDRSIEIALGKKAVTTVYGMVRNLPPGFTTKRVMVTSDDGNTNGEIDAGGAFRIEDAPVGNARIFAEVRSDGSSRFSKVQIRELKEGVPARLDLEFISGSAVSGRVTKDGVALNGAMVSFNTPDSYEGTIFTTSDADGRYEATGLEDGTYRVRVSSMQLRDGFETVYRVKGGGTFDIDVRSGTLSGRAIDASDEQPIEGVVVSLVRLDAGAPVDMHSYRTITSNRKGTFTMTFPGDGRYRAVAQREGYGHQLNEFEVRNGTTSDLTFRMQRAKGMKVKLVDGRDQRMLSGVVIARDLQKRIVFNGNPEFDVEGAAIIPVAPGDYLISASANGYASVTVRAQAPGSSLVIPLTPGGTLVIESERDLRGTARLVRPDGEEYVRCWCNGIATIRLEGTRTVVPNVAPGAYQVELIDPSGEILGKTSAVVMEGQSSAATVP